MLACTVLYLLVCGWLEMLGMLGMLDMLDGLPLLSSSSVCLEAHVIARSVAEPGKFIPPRASADHLLVAPVLSLVNNMSPILATGLAVHNRAIPVEPSSRLGVTTFLSPSQLCQLAAPDL